MTRYQQLKQALDAKGGFCNWQHHVKDPGHTIECWTVRGQEGPVLLIIQLWTSPRAAGVPGMDPDSLEVYAPLDRLNSMPNLLAEIEKL